MPRDPDLGFVGMTAEQEEAVAKERVTQSKLDTQLKARRVAIMQEHKHLLEQANGITKNRR